MILGYLDTNPKNSNIEQQREQILEYAKKQGFEITLFIKNSNLYDALKNLEKGKEKTIIVISNIVAMGTTMKKIQNEFTRLSDLDISIATAKEEYFWAPEDFKTAPVVLKMVSDLRSSMVSVLTTKALQECKIKGIQLGKKGENKRRALDDKIEDIIKMKTNGLSNRNIAKHLNVSSATLYNFYILHPELNKRSKKSSLAQ